MPFGTEIDKSCVRLRLHRHNPDISARVRGKQGLRALRFLRALAACAPTPKCFGGCLWPCGFRTGAKFFCGLPWLPKAPVRGRPQAERFVNIPDSFGYSGRSFQAWVQSAPPKSARKRAPSSPDVSSLICGTFRQYFRFFAAFQTAVPHLGHKFISRFRHRSGGFNFPSSRLHSAKRLNGKTSKPIFYAFFKPACKASH